MPTSPPSPPPTSPGDSSTLPTTYPMPTLPLEIIGIVVSFLGKPQLAVCARVSRVLSGLTLRTAPISGGSGSSPGPCITRYLADVHNPESTSSASPRTPPRRISELDRFEHTQHLTIRPHLVTLCDRLPPFHMPNLVTLSYKVSAILAPNGFYTHNLDIDVCGDSHTQTYPTPMWLSPSSSSGPTLGCELLSRLQPRRIIFGGQQCGLEGSSHSSWSAFLPPPPSAKEIVILAGEESMNYSAWTNGRMPLLTDMPATVDRLSIVMWCWGGGWTIKERSDYQLYPFPGSFLKLLPGRMAIACSGKAKKIKFIGYETIARFRAAELEEVIAWIREELRVILVERGWEAVEADKRAQSISFVTGDEYLTREGDAAMRESREAVRETIREDLLEMGYDV